MLKMELVGGLEKSGAESSPTSQRRNVVTLWESLNKPYLLERL